MDIGAKIKILRKEQGMTQAELAEKSGVAQSAISYIETEGKKPNVHTVSKLAKALGVSPTALFEDERPYRDLHLSAISTSGARLQEESPPLNYKQDLENILAQENIWFNGALLTEEDKEDILNVMRLIWRKKETEGNDK